MSFIDKGLTFIIYYTEQDTEICRSKLNIEMTGSGQFEVDRRDHNVESFRLNNFNSNFDAFDKFVKLTIPLYNKFRNIN